MSYDHNDYMRVWRLKKKGASPIVSASGGEVSGYVLRRGGFIALYDTRGRRTS